MINLSKIFSKNKKSLATSALVRTIITIITLIAVLSISTNIYGSIINTEEKYVRSFEEFVDNANNVKVGIETFTLSLKKNSAIIGFSKNSDSYKCIDCYAEIGNPKPIVVIEKPRSSICSQSACICLCNGLKLEDKKTKEESMRVGQCEKLYCKTLESDIIDETPIKAYMEVESGAGPVVIEIKAMWNNGFLFANSIYGANGLKQYDKVVIPLYVEKKQNIIGICNPDIRKYHKQEFGFDGCIAKKFDNSNLADTFDISMSKDAPSSLNIEYIGGANDGINFQRANRKADSNDIQFIVVHTCEGSYESCINEIRTKEKKKGAHYVVSKNGKISQIVLDKDIAFHAGNSDYNAKSIGIEHEGLSNEASTWTQEMLQSSAKLSKWLSIKYSIPIDRSHIIGHNEVPGCPSSDGGGLNCHKDPGNYFDWSNYISLINTISLESS